MIRYTEDSFFAFVEEHDTRLEIGFWKLAERSGAAGEALRHFYRKDPEKCSAGWRLRCWLEFVLADAGAEQWAVDQHAMFLPSLLQGLPVERWPSLTVEWANAFIEERPDKWTEADKIQILAKVLEELLPEVK